MKTLQKKKSRFFDKILYIVISLILHKQLHGSINLTINGKLNKKIIYLLFKM